MAVVVATIVVIAVVMVAVLPPTPVVVTAVVAVDPVAELVVMPMRGLVPAGRRVPTMRRRPTLRDRPANAFSPDGPEVVVPGHPMMHMIQGLGEVVPHLVPDVLRQAAYQALRHYVCP